MHRNFAVPGVAMQYQTLLFYRYARIENAAAFAAEHLAFCKTLGIKGRILIGEEGINGSVSGTEVQCDAYRRAIQAVPILAGTEFRTDLVEEPSFNRIHVRYRPEIVRFAAAEDVDPNVRTGTYLSPEEFRRMKEDDDVVLLDTRNTVEHALGKFRNAYTLDIDHFRDFPDRIRQLEKFRDKKILAYCTGGIRCEKATAYLLKKGFRNVYQLHGGIIQYGKETGGVDFEGRCYVFDKRLSVEVNKVNPKVLARCMNCGAASERMVNCANPECNTHFVQCTSCAERLEGACSETCRQHPRKRKFNGSGYYAKDETE